MRQLFALSVSRERFLGRSGFSRLKREYNLIHARLKREHGLIHAGFPKNKLISL